jgi:predicted phage baseplate assembly protein
VNARQISLLVTRPLNVKDVINPLPATGGADKESRDLARTNAPLAVQALDRLVGVQDYADFARTFAGVAKASAAALSDGERQVVQITIAGVDDIPIAPSSDLFHNLTKAIRDYGDPYTPFRVTMRELLLLVLQANVRVLPDYLWTAVEPKVRAALLNWFSFQRRELGQDALLSEIFSVIQAVAGVAYVDVDVFDALDDAKVKDQIAAKAPLSLERRERIKVRMDSINGDETNPSQRLRPAQVACFTPAVPDTLVLTEIKS